MTALLLMALLSFWRNTISFLKQQHLVGFHADVLLCVFSDICICNSSMTGISIFNLELINCFQFLRLELQQVTICASLLPLHNLTALALHQSWPFSVSTLFFWQFLSFTILGRIVSCSNSFELIFPGNWAKTHAH